MRKTFTVALVAALMMPCSSFAFSIWGADSESAVQKKPLLEKPIPAQPSYFPDNTPKKTNNKDGTVYIQTPGGIIPIPKSEYLEEEDIAREMEEKIKAQMKEHEENKKNCPTCDNPLGN